MQVRHPFERLVSAYQSKVVRSTDEWYFLVFVLNDTFWCWIWLIYNWIPHTGTTGCGLAWNRNLETPPSPPLLRWSLRKGKRFPFDTFDVHPMGVTRSIRLCFRFLIKLIIQVCRAPGKSSCGFDKHWKPFVSRFLSSSPPNSHFQQI